MHHSPTDACGSRCGVVPRFVVRSVGVCDGSPCGHHVAQSVHHVPLSMAASLLVEDIIVESV